KHLPITPARWGGFCEWLLWAMQSPNHRACVLRHYEGAATQPGGKMFLIDTARLKGEALAKAKARNAEAPAQLAAVGAGDLLHITYGDYVEAEAGACDRICSTELLREFWLHGAPIVTGDRIPTDIQQRALRWPVYPREGTPDNRGRLLACSVNDPSSQWKYITDKQSYTGTVKVWACATKHADGRILIYAWTACELGAVEVAVPGLPKPVPINLAGRSSAYTLVRPDSGTFVSEDVTP
ncbi:MAG TPA: hypothetical protein VL475_00070, partial [Planctomycetaceae bacterium]|nr:hypothetical protein [Planctomycetaceae bacterium]